MVGDASDPYVMVHSRYEFFLEVEKFVGCSNEVEKYLAEIYDGRRDVNFEVLGWWKDNSSRYLLLFKVANDMLAVLVSTIVSKSAFSIGGHIVDPFQSSLSLSWFKTLYVHKISFKPQYQFLITKGWGWGIGGGILCLGNMFKF